RGERDVVHRRLAHLFAGSAGLLRHDHFPRGRPLHGRLHRQRQGTGEGRRQDAHDLPHPRQRHDARRLQALFLEGGAHLIIGSDRLPPVKRIRVPTLSTKETAMARGIKDKVAILGMGCSKFGERWDSGAEELMLEAYKECIADSGIDAKQINAAWFSTAIDEVHVGKSGIPLSTTLRLPNIPVTHVENMCASGTEAFRGACYAVASGAADFALALGVEKLKDTGYGGLPGGRGGPAHVVLTGHGPAPAHVPPPGTAHMAAPGVVGEDPKQAIGHVAWKSHQNGAKHPKAHLQKAVEMETILKAPMTASPLGLFDCCGVSDGAAAAIVTTPEIAKSLGKHNIVSVKALQLSVSNGSESGPNSWDGSYFHTTRIAPKKAYQEAATKQPPPPLPL